MSRWVIYPCLALVVALLGGLLPFVKWQATSRHISPAVVQKIDETEAMKATYEDNERTKSVLKGTLDSLEKSQQELKARMDAAKTPVAAPPPTRAPIDVPAVPRDNTVNVKLPGSQGPPLK